MKRIIKNASRSLAFIFILMTFARCGANEAGTRVGNPPTVETTQAFPSRLAIASPLETSTEFSASVSEFLISSEPMYATSYSLRTTRIEDILNGTALTDCAFDPSNITLQPTNATCYGPTVDYLNHPDATSPPDDGELPRGDVGIWTENEGDTEQACASAQLNARMQGITDKAQVALESLASLICVSNVNSIDLPTAGNTSALTTEMNDMISAYNAASATDIEISFNSAALSLAADGETYTYDLEFTYSDDLAVDHTVNISMTHQGEADGETYRGSFAYVVGNMNPTGNCGSARTTEAGSVLYNLDASTDLKVRSDYANFCTDAADPIQSNGLIAASDKYDAASNSDGWANDFSSILANFNPQTSAGDYVFSWQAGPDDGNTRTFNVTLAESSGVLDGTAFFGFGDDIEETDGSITGFICNWAGPNAGPFGGKTVSAHVQRQGLQAAAAGDFFTSVSADLNIGYAPTKSCSYNGAGTFTYDSDGDGTIDTNAATAVSNELLPVTNADGDETFDELESAGFSLPESPAEI